MVTSQAWPNKNKPWLGSSNTWPNLAKYNKARLLQHNQAVQATTHYFSRSKVTIEDPEMIFKRALLPPYFRSQPQTLFHRNYYNPVPPDSNQQATQLSSFLLVWISPTTTNNPFGVLRAAHLLVSNNTSLNTPLFSIFSGNKTTPVSTGPSFFVQRYLSPLHSWQDTF